MNISVVIPLYNKALHIERAINSINNQSFQAKEIIVIDDGSTDSSVDVVKQINNPLVRLIQQKNAGVGAARNRGVKEAKFDLLAFLDADDEWKPNFLLHIKRLINNFPDSGAYATSYEIIEPNNSITYPKLIGIPTVPWIGVMPNLFELMQFGSPFFPSSVVIPKNVYLTLGGFPEGIKQGEDRILWIRLGLEYPIAFSPSPDVVYHRDASNRACNTFDPVPATAIFIQNLLNEEKIPKSLIKDMENLYASLIIQKSSLAIKEGHNRLARSLLKTIIHNRKYYKDVIWWFIWSLMPISFIKLIIKVRMSKY